MASAIFLFLALLFQYVNGEDFYELLGVARDSDDRTIRKAFKRLAILKHPDKNPEDKDAHAAFVRINRAYEVLKDEELRKKYDQFGEEGLSSDFHGGQSYQSWQFYQDNFGIYDDDPEIVTLSRSDFERVVLESGDLWFVNFYSTFCSHCHDLAPTWRKFAREMDGVLRIGAVNCAEDPMLCQSQNVMGYPSLVLYPKREFFNGGRDLDSLSDFILRRLAIEIHHVTTENVAFLSEEWTQYSHLPWLLDFCDDHDACLSSNNRRKVASMLKGIANVGSVHCFEGREQDPLCERLGRTQGVVFFPAGKIQREEGQVMASLDPKEIVNAVLELLPSLSMLDLEQLQTLEKVDSDVDFPTLVYFIASTAASNEELAREMKKLPALLAGVCHVAMADCQQLGQFCTNKNLMKLPQFVMFKQDGGYEISYGKVSLHEVVSFARESAKSNLISLDSRSYNAAISSGDSWLIDYFAPWCPPCLKLLPELRKLHHFLDPMVRLGTIDCTIHTAICQQAQASSYPTTIFYHAGRPHQSVGYHTADYLAEFIIDLRNPSVIELNPDEMRKRVLARESSQLWLVDFHLPWCGPCQQLAPEFRKLARSVQEVTNAVSFGAVDCQMYGSFCAEMHVHNYPTIRLFPAGFDNHVDYPSNWWRDHGSIQRWLQDYLPSKVAKMGNDFYDLVVNSDEAWLVDFYAPWCGHCVQFAPVFEHLATVLEGRVRLAKVNCDDWPGVCHAVHVRAYPTLRFYLGGGEIDGRTTEKVDGLHIQTQHMDSIVDIVEAQLKKRRKRVKDEF